MSDAESEPADEFEKLDMPSQGVPEVVQTPTGLDEAISALGQGTGPVAIDAERASGFRYGQKAYLVQLRREGAGSWLIDPVPFETLPSLDSTLADAEWVLHAATQDIPCLRDLGLHPRSLFDTELGARLAGLPKVGLSAVLEYYLGVTLAKEHSAVDWSTRPLPEPWLRYAALDVELLIELRNRMEQDLAEQGKLEWARQEFEALVEFTGPRQNGEAWRRTSGIQRLRRPRAVAVLRELWLTRDQIARERDVASGRVLPDSTLVDLAHRLPTRADQLTAPRPDPSRSRARRAERGLLRYQRVWLDAIQRGLSLPEDELPPAQIRNGAPPQPRVWADRDPAAAERLTRARAELAELSEQLDIPVENLMTPETVRRVLWKPPTDPEPAVVEEILSEHGARAWQRELVGPILRRAIQGG